MLKKLTLPLERLRPTKPLLAVHLVNLRYLNIGVSYSVTLNILSSILTTRNHSRFFSGLRHLESVTNFPLGHIDILRVFIGLN